jgi:hypothetical protein
MNYKNYFDTLKEQKTIENQYKLSKEIYEKEVVYQAYCEIIDFLAYVHNQGYRRPDGNPLNHMLSRPEEFKTDMFHNISRKGGASLLLDNEISSFAISYKNNGIEIECNNHNGTKRFTTVESFIKRISETILDTFVIVENSEETLEYSHWDQREF